MEPASTLRRRILLVDDDSTLRTIVRRILGTDSFDVLDAESCDAALALAATELGVIDLLLTDVVMPGTSVSTMVSRLRAARPELQVLYMSGYGSEVLPRHGIPPKVPLLQKPFTPHGLRASVQRLLAPEVAP